MTNGPGPRNVSRHPAAVPGQPGPRLLALRDILRATDHPLALAELRGRFLDAKAKELREALDTITALGVTGGGGVAPACRSGTLTTNGA